MEPKALLRFGRSYWPLSLVLVGFYVPVLLWISGVVGRSPEQRGLSDFAVPLARSLGIAGVAATFAMVIGAVLALGLAVYPVRGRGVLCVVLLTPFLLPAVVVTNGLNSLLAGGPLNFLIRGTVGAIFISTAQMAPLVLWGISRSLRSLPKAESDATRLLLAPRKQLRSLLARVAPDVGRFGLLVFVLLFPRLEVPLYTGVETVGTRILTAFTAGESDVQGLTLVAITILISVPIFLLALRVLSAVTPGALDGSPDPRPTRPEFTVLAWLVGGAMLLPLLAMARMAMAPVPTAELVYMNRGLAVELVRALLVATPLAWLGWRLAERRSPVAAAIFCLPMLLPGTLPGLALSLGVQAHLPYALVDLPVLLCLGQACRFAGVAYFFGVLARGAVPQAERDSLHLALRERRRNRVLLGRVAPILATGILVLTVLILGEVETAALLVPPGYVSPVVEVHQFLHFRFDEQAAQYSLALTLTCTLLALALSRIGKGLR